LIRPGMDGSARTSILRSAENARFGLVKIKTKDNRNQNLLRISRIDCIPKQGLSCGHIVGGFGGISRAKTLNPERKAPFGLMFSNGFPVPIQPNLTTGTPIRPITY
jgi:hypothetical protein